MRLLWLLFTLLAANSAFAGDRMPSTLQSVMEKDQWALAEGLHKGKPRVIRHREGLHGNPDLSGYPKLIRVVWTYPPAANGMPSPDSSDQMHTFEGLLVAAVEPSLTAFLVA